MGNPQGGYTTQPMMMPQQQQAQQGQKSGFFSKVWRVIKKIFDAIIFGFGATIGSKIANAIF